MTEKERFMYLLMGKISTSNAPIVFKGAMVTKMILAESGYTDIERQTRDVDANWIGSLPSMDTLVNTINDSLGQLKDRVFAIAFREHGEKMSAGISFREKQTNDELVSMDVDMRPINGSKVYSYGEISFKGVLPNEILSDKISVLSSRMIFRRAKDLIDVYALTHCVTVNTSDIFVMVRDNPNRTIGAFDEFYNRRQDVEHSYKKLRGVENKPPFDVVYSYLKEFIKPFANEDVTPLIWHSDNKSWKKTT
jgi:hypothetical protein